MYDCSVILWWLHFRIIYLYFYTNIVWVEFFLPLQLFTWLGEHSPSENANYVCHVMLQATLSHEFRRGQGIWGRCAAVLLTLMLSCCVGRGLSASSANTCLCYAWHIRASSLHHSPLLASIHCPLPTVHCPVFTVQCPPSGAQCPESCFQRQALAD